LGPEEIVYGDKVINLANTDPKMPWNRHRKVYPEKDNPYIANGEIGMAVGFFGKGSADLRWKLEVEFSSQPNFKYDFTAKDFGEEAIRCWSWLMRSPCISLKAASLVPSFWFCQSVSTAFQRAALHGPDSAKKSSGYSAHGARGDLRKYSSDDRSETAAD
jgi:hypothetical protein